MTERKNQPRATSARTSLKKKQPCALACAERKPLDQKKKPAPRHQRENQLKKKKQPRALARAERKPLDRKRKLPRATGARCRQSVTTIISAFSSME